MTPDQLKTLVGDITLFQALIWTFAAIALIAVIVKGWPKIRRFVQTIDALGELPETLKKVNHELTTNHGSSLKDAVQRMETKLGEHLRNCERNCGKNGDAP